MVVGGKSGWLPVTQNFLPSSGLTERDRRKSDAEKTERKRKTKNRESEEKREREADLRGCEKKLMSFRVHRGAFRPLIPSFFQLSYLSFLQPHQKPAVESCLNQRSAPFACLTVF
mmetsp:Transcript_12317/g.23879  ORF Transcript_12317/g.23879 Transcript_12317/m.23879 type:complete len:115 (-) Transcript_12317:1038-1382(-)